MSSILEMMLHLADESSREVKERDRSRSTVSKRVVTQALLERQEWDAFVARLKRRRALLNLEEQQPGDEDAIALDVDEDDIDMLIALVGVLDNGDMQRVCRPMTLTEIVSALQREKVVSVEFTAPARDQTRRLLVKLRQLNRAWVDDFGRWSLL